MTHWQNHPDSPGRTIWPKSTAGLSSRSRLHSSYGTYRKLIVWSILGTDPEVETLPQPVALTVALTGSCRSEYSTVCTNSPNSRGVFSFTSAMSLWNGGLLKRLCTKNRSTPYRLPPDRKSFVPTSTCTSLGGSMAQWAAVSTHWRSMMVPPHIWLNSPCSDTWYGAEPGAASVPPTMRPLSSCLG
uniref:Uncharacterized protein n=1 Tax=Anopheles melas TaxID=34690 RepID=A0A182U2U2_9DIPT